MASEIRVDKINSLSGVGTVTLSPTGVDIAGITTVATFKVGTGVTASSDGDIFATGVTTSTTFVGALTGNVTGNISGGTVAGSTGTFTGDVDIADKIIHTGDTNTAIRFPSADTITAETGGTERLRINSTGQTIVGDTVTQLTTNSERPFQVHSVNGPKIAIGRNDTSISDGNTIGGIEFYGNDNNGTFVNTAAIIVDADGAHGDDDKPTRMLFYTTADGGSSATERLRIASDGQLRHTYDIGSNGDAGLILNTDDGTKASSILFQANTENRARIDVQRLAGDGAQLKIQVSQMDNSNTMLDAITIAPTTSGDTTPDVTLTGNLAFASGNGIDFSATSDASGSSSELLDDYEEGVHTVTVTCTSSGTITLDTSHNKLAYHKIGNWINVHGRVRVTSTSSPSGQQLRLSLPYQSASEYSGDASRIYGVAAIELADENSNNYGIQATYAGQSFVQVGNINTNTTNPADVCSQVNSNSLISINVTYRTA